jgi:hypothetical protein
MIQFFSNGLKFLSATSVSSSSTSSGIVYTYTSNANELVIINGRVTSTGFGNGFIINLDGINVSGTVFSQGGSFVIANGAQFKIETVGVPYQASWNLVINRFTIQG